jgi:nucleoside-diphosphate-sugar epimerase/predicted dehydrogenase
MRLVVTGASGFLGGAFARAAAGAGHQVVALGRSLPAPLPGIEVVEAELGAIDGHDLPAGTDAVVHFASPTSFPSEKAIETARELVLGMLAAAHEARIPRFLHISSLSALGEGAALEQAPERRGAYARSKALAEQAVRTFAANGAGPAVTVVRPGLVFGADMPSALAGTAVRLPLGLAVGLGLPAQRVPFLDVADLNRAVLALLEQPAGERLKTFNALSLELPSKGELLHAHERLTGFPVKTLWLPRRYAFLLATVFDLAGHARRRPTDVRYALKRMYGLQPEQLGGAELWRSIDRAPSVSLRTSLAAATAGRQGGEEEPPTRERRQVARALLACGNDCVQRAPEPLVLVGAGRVVSDMHVRALAETGAFTVTHVVDHDPDRAATIASLLGATPVTKLDAVPASVWSSTSATIATPGGTHGRVAVELLERGVRSLLVEKPTVLTRGEFESLRAAADGRPVSTFLNYRLRPAALGLWQFLSNHDPGALLAASVLFHSSRLQDEPTRWLRHEFRARALVMELAVHFIDLAVVLAGELSVESVHRRASEREAALRSVSGTLGNSSGAAVALDLDVSGTAMRTRVTLQFERAACELAFFPESFRVLPAKAHPADDLVADVRRIVRPLRERARSRAGRARLRCEPHARIYAHHRRVLEGHPPCFGLDEVEPTLSSLFSLADATYPAEVGTATSAS